MSKHIGGNLIVIKATIDGEIIPGQYRIENETRDIEGEWDDIYVCVSGYFGAAGPHVFAAAPELLEALIEVTASLAWNAHGECRAIHDDPIMPSAQAVEFARAAIAKAKGEK